MKKKVIETYFEDKSAYPTFVMEDGTVREAKMSDAGVWWGDADPAPEQRHNEGENFRLEFCHVCNQMTNHLPATCLKCGKEDG